MTSGIYKITSPTNKIYIGESLNIERRWSHYKTLNCKQQHKLLNSFKKYGVINHKFEILEELLFLNKQILLSKEKYYINLYLDKGFQLLNILKGDEVRKKWKTYVPVEPKKVYQYDLFGEFIKEFISAKEASKELKIRYTGIINCVAKRQFTTKGFIFSYEKYEKPFKEKVELPLEVYECEKETIIKDLSIELVEIEENSWIFNYF